LRPLLPVRDGGDHPFSRYENGKTKPPLALVKLLKVLDRHPDLLEAIKAALRCCSQSYAQAKPQVAASSPAATVRPETP